jgi:hypothetical protein
MLKKMALLGCVFNLNSPPLVPILSQMNAVHALIPCLRFVLISSFRLHFLTIQMVTFLQVFRPKCMHLSSLPCVLWLAHAIVFDLEYSGYCGKIANVNLDIIHNLLQPSVTSSHLGPVFFLSTLFSKLRVLPLKWGMKFHTHATGREDKRFETDLQQPDPEFNRHLISFVSALIYFCHSQI